MAKFETIKENYTFRRLYKSKHCYVYPQIVVYVAKNRLGVFRYGITTSKKVGNAVTRSRCRRVIRAALSMYKDEIESRNINASYDVVFVARVKCAHVKSFELYEPIGESLRRSGVIK
ncbi:MAG: ribonuclease P protein component [Clostridia bacterium]|nr:ribonuclease P protein component [Clostridia bacterium]